MRSNKRVTVRSGAWFGDREVALNLPPSWEVNVLAPEEAPKMGEAQIEAAFARPIGTPPIVAMARGKSSATIVLDDLRALGNLADGMPVYINPVVADADFKICLGGIYPHAAVGFGGGAKLILPGVSGFAHPHARRKIASER